MADFKKATVASLRYGEHYDVYVGRAGQGLEGPFGNPFRAVLIGRMEAVRQHGEWLRKRCAMDLDFLGKVLALRGKRLGCFCGPGQACHGKNLADFVNMVEECAAEDPVLGKMNLPFGCSVCVPLGWTQVSSNHRQCPGCDRWLCHTHLPEGVHACPGK